MADDRGETSADAENGNAVEPGQADGTAEKRRSQRPGDIPSRVADRYMIEERGLRQEVRLFEQPRDKDPAIRDLGHRLIQARESQAIVRDMVEIAAHRHWDKIRVSGSDSFRRMVAAEARTRGIAVDGERALDPSAAVNDRSNPAPSRDAMNRDSPNQTRADFREGVQGVVLEHGLAVYQDRPGRRPSPYVDIDLGGGHVRRAWGADLPAALGRARADLGDEILLRQENAPPGSGKRARPWTAEVVRAASRDHLPDPTAIAGSPGERFREASPAQRAEDKELRAAQSQLIAARALAAAYFPHDPASAAVVATRLEGAIMAALDKGGRFKMARTRMQRDGRHELALERGARPMRKSDRDKPAKPHPEIRKVRDRGRRR